MTFVWPEALWLLLAVPAMAGAYFWLLRRRKRTALRYASVGLVRAALGPGATWRRHLPPAILLMAMVAAIVAIARPEAVVTLPSGLRTIMLAIDVSLSMRAADVEPSRIAAAQAAARTFVQAQPGDVRIGIVTFAGTAALVQPPTRNREDLIAAIDRFDLQRHTAIGSGLMLSLATLFPEEGIELESFTAGGASGDRSRGRALDAPPKVEKKPPVLVPPGSYKAGAIILLTDGRRTIGPNPIDVARICADHGVRVYTVGFGKAEGAMANVDGYSMYMAFDEETLKAIADVTRAKYFHAATADDLKKVYETLNARYVLEKERSEVSALVAAAAGILILLAAALSLVWFGRAL